VRQVGIVGFHPAQTAMGFKWAAVTTCQFILIVK
jgi:hypothetical protein